MERRARELNAKQQQLVAERRKGEEDRLLTAISANMAFHKGRPVAALVVFRCCLQWRSFQVRPRPCLQPWIILASPCHQLRLGRSCVAGHPKSS